MKTGIEINNEAANLEPHHREAILNAYAANNIGEDISERLAFWKDSECSISHNPTPEMRLAIHEQCFLVETFPREFTFY